MNTKCTGSRHGRDLLFSTQSLNTGSGFDEDTGNQEIGNGNGDQDWQDAKE
jgi:hypothetical protein